MARRDSVAGPQNWLSAGASASATVSGPEATPIRGRHEDTWHVATRSPRGSSTMPPGASASATVRGRRPRLCVVGTRNVTRLDSAALEHEQLGRRSCCRRELPRAQRARVRRPAQAPHALERSRLGPRGALTEPPPPAPWSGSPSPAKLRAQRARGRRPRPCFARRVIGLDDHPPGSLRSGASASATRSGPDANKQYAPYVAPVFSTQSPRGSNGTTSTRPAERPALPPPRAQRVRVYWVRLCVSARAHVTRRDSVPGGLEKRNALRHEETSHVATWSPRGSNTIRSGAPASADVLDRRALSLTGGAGCTRTRSRARSRARRGTPRIRRAP